MNQSFMSENNEHIQYADSAVNCDGERSDQRAQGSTLRLKEKFERIALRQSNDNFRLSTTSLVEIERNQFGHQSSNYS
ncbi:hypothetical protein SNEBB_003383 [Seison nebaliae]|nr:hypothetical protein SNEBB_003383 [Seison nebaliae]